MKTQGTDDASRGVGSVRDSTDRLEVDTTAGLFPIAVTGGFRPLGAAKFRGHFGFRGWFGLRRRIGDRGRLRRRFLRVVLFHDSSRNKQVEDGLIRHPIPNRQPCRQERFGYHTLARR